jgi:hypothetical protein
MPQADMFEAKYSAMKKSIFLWATAFFTLSLASCDREPYALDLTQYDISWYDADHSGSRSLDDELDFLIQASTTNPDADEQYFREWELSYAVNGHYAGVLLGNDNDKGNTITVDARILLGKLNYPGQGSIEKNDKITFRFWAADNCGTEIERNYSFVIED